MTTAPALLGVRHHGPGSARAVRAALDRCRPSAVLIEGPPEADAIVHLAADPRMRPPVALLAHATDDPGRAAFWPLAEFSPEWVALRWALSHDVPVRFIDLPAAVSLALGDERLPGAGDPGEEGGLPAGWPDAASVGSAVQVAAACGGPSRWNGLSGQGVLPGTQWSGEEEVLPAGRPDAVSVGSAVQVAAACGGPSRRNGLSGQGVLPGTQWSDEEEVLPAGRPDAVSAEGAAQAAAERSGLSPRDGFLGQGALPRGLPVGRPGAACSVPAHGNGRFGRGVLPDAGFLGEEEDRPGVACSRPSRGNGLFGEGALPSARRLGVEGAPSAGRPGGASAGGAAQAAAAYSGSSRALPGAHRSDVEGALPAGRPDVAPAGAAPRRDGTLGRTAFTGAACPNAAPDGVAAPGPTGRDDPLGALAAAAGYDDAEAWWEDAVEHRRERGADDDALAPFLALAEAMAELRADSGPVGARDAVREAHMRLKLREARREFGDGVAVVCGAWHVPALAEKRTVASDRQLLKGLPKVKAAIGWVPWTHRRLARRSGYGAGVTSPGWYAHLFHAPDRVVERWMTTVARLLREEDRPVSSAHVIEAVRLAGTLAAMRGRPLAGLAETTDAVRAVMCDGSDVPLALVQDRLVIGDVLGEVPDSAPAVPLQRDLDRLQRSLRLKPEAAVREREFDLRTDNDAARSRLLHRLRLLGVAWGEPVRSRGSLGTFRETWRLCWEPESAVRVAEAGIWGTTVEGAATAKAESLARESDSLAEVTALAEQCLLAGLPDALPVVMRALADRAALDTDVGHLARALPALVRSVRYGDVRRTDIAALGEVAEGIAERVFIGLPAACAGLDADAAAEMRGHVDAVHQAVGLLGKEPLRELWAAVLGTLAAREHLPGGIKGRAVRLLLDDGRLPEGEAARLMGLALSAGAAPAEAAAWIEGFTGSGGSGGMLLVHDERLLALVDAWLTGVPPDAFTDVLPLLRRTFSAYEPGVRRSLGELIRRGGEGAPAPAGDGMPGFGPGLDAARAAAVLPTLRLLLGLDARTETEEEDTSPALTGGAPQ
ncbi:DUF5682 family protein [Streptomyces sp. NPDC001262]|uniref:DUF5682 family protein n=1 Tax=Streptomyces sp. NPDC001262 TaxID=3364552 RepID=UPI0036792A98